MSHLLSTLHTKNNLRGSQQTKTQEWKINLRKKHNNPSTCQSRESSEMGKQRRLEAAKWPLATPSADCVLESQAAGHSCCHQEKGLDEQICGNFGEKEEIPEQQSQSRIGTGAAMLIFYIWQVQSEFSLFP